VAAVAQVVAVLAAAEREADLMRTISRTTRSAFSLLEMVLALALALVLMLALYLTLSTYMTNAHVGRELLADGEISRSIMARITQDVTNQVGAFDTRCLPDYSGAAAAAASGSASGSATQDPTMTAPAVIPNSAPVDAVAFNVGVQGSGGTLRLSVYRVENPSVGNIATANQASTDIVSDLRRVDYWLVTSGSQTIGLARREIKLATSADIDLDPSEISEQEKYIIAREVTGVTFEFHDGQGWQSEWDGSQPKSVDDGTPLGPPAAIKITLTIRNTASKLFATNALEVGGPDLTFVHVIAVPGSNNFTPKATNP
jgi:hypothetical protein